MRPNCPPPRTPIVAPGTSSNDTAQSSREGRSATALVCAARQAERRASIAGSAKARIAAASSAALIAPGLPYAQGPPGPPAGICTIEYNESCPPSAGVSMGTPKTGSAVSAAVMPGRWAAPPAPAMMILKPAALAPCANATSRSGVRCAETIRAAKPILSASRRAAAWRIVSQSDSLPRIMATGVSTTDNGGPNLQFREVLGINEGGGRGKGPEAEACEHGVMGSRVLAFLCDESNRALLAGIGGGFAPSCRGRWRSWRWAQQDLEACPALVQQVAAIIVLSGCSPRQHKVLRCSNAPIGSSLRRWQVLTKIATSSSPE